MRGRFSPTLLILREVGGDGLDERGIDEDVGEEEVEEAEEEVDDDGISWEVERGNVRFGSSDFAFFFLM